ncbi:MAG TPA: hypothetical protein VLG49_01510 [Rhabdochlamydiaceae bacterium]|nr:hypothetical protein [Rhabdochlamydiaceae bacterium]
MSYISTFVERLINFDVSLRSLDEKINYITGHQVGDVDPLNKEVNDRYQECSRNIASLEEDTYLVEKCASGKMKNGILSQFDSLKTAHENLKAKIEEAVVICETTAKLDQIFKNLEIIKGPYGYGIEELERLKSKNIDILESPKLTPVHLKSILEIDELIEEQESLHVEAMLGKIDDLIKSPIPNGDSETKCMDSLKKILLQDLPICQIGRAIQHHIFENIWIEAGEPEGDSDWGRNHALDDLDRLSAVLRKEQLFPEDRIQNERSISSKEDCNSFEDFISPPVQTPIEGDEENPFDADDLLNTLSGLDTRLDSSSDDDLPVRFDGRINSQ